MADLSVIRQRLMPWPSTSDPRRYYVNNVGDLIHDALWAECNRTGYGKPADVVRYAKVWFDDRGQVHVEGIYDPEAAEVIARLVDREFSPQSPPPYAQELEWAEVTDALPHDLKDETYIFHYKGRDYCVNTTVYCREREGNKAFRLLDGSVSFESDSSDLWELVIELVKDKLVKPKQACDTALPWDTLSEFSALPDPIDFGNPGTDGRPQKKVEPRPLEMPDSKPRVTLRRLTDDELEEIAREQAAETRHPKSRWTKAEVLDVCRRAGVPRESLNALNRMKLDDIRSTLLLFDGTEITGNDYIDEQQRHTRFYRLDLDSIRRLGREE